LSSLTEGLLPCLFQFLSREILVVPLLLPLHLLLPPLLHGESLLPFQLHTPRLRVTLPPDKLIALLAQNLTISLQCAVDPLLRLLALLQVGQVPLVRLLLKALAALCIR
ncbi:hypothetical protein Vafri_970, partial [Volvox africanus]